MPEAVYAALQWQLEIVLAALANPSELAADASGSGVGVDRRCRGYSALVEVAQWSRLGGALVDRRVARVYFLIEFREFLGEGLQLFRTGPGDVLDRARP